MASGVKLGEEIEYFPLASGTRAIMRSKKTQSMLFGYAEDIASEASSMSEHGGEFSARPIGEPVTGIVSAHAFVITEDYNAALDQTLNNVLNKALRGA